MPHLPSPPGIAANAPQRVPVPRPPQPPAPHPFPLLATVAPILAAAVLYLVTSSPFAIAFAALGPVIAIASSLDARLGARRAGRRERARFLADCDRCDRVIRAEHQREEERLSRLARPAHRVTADHGLDPEGWRASADGPIAVRLGSGEVPSEVEFLPPEDVTDEFSTMQLSELAARARTLVGPVIVDARLGIGFVGPAVLATAAARAVVVQLAAALPPATTVVESKTSAGWAWLDSLPHSRAVPAPRDVSAGPGPDGAYNQVTFSQTAASGAIAVAVAAREESLPHSTRVVISVGDHPAVVRHPDPAALGRITPDYVTEVQSLIWAQRRRVLAEAHGLGVPDHQIPLAVPLSALLGRRPDGDYDADTGDLSCVIGAAADGELVLDLAADGPHAVVGGTTGSGKSELLVTWVLALAALQPPSRVSFLFVDFKGGASFQSLAQLPHCVGVITDLDEHEALRALSSMRAEIRWREERLAAASLRSIDDGKAGQVFPRLILVVDEYAVIVEEYPDLHPLFSDLAARGRSLGIHLILCTQRPAGVVRDGIMSNCGLRISLRVNSAADSSAVVGTGAAAALPQTARGRAVVVRAGAEPVQVQIALAAPDDVARVAAGWPNAGPSRRPWMEPLPAVVTPADVADQMSIDGANGPRAHGLAFGLSDIPREQRRAIATYNPASDGNLLVVGGPGSGKSGALAALGASAGPDVRVIAARGLASVWDCLVAALTPGNDAAQRSHGPTLLLIDDIDATLLGCDDEWGPALVDLLSRVLREGPAAGVTCAVTAQRVPGMLQSALALCGASLVLKMPSRQEHLLAGADAQSFSQTLPPGGGIWRGVRVQVTKTVGGTPSVAARVGDLSRWGAHAVVPPRFAVVTSDPRRVEAHIQRLWPGRPAVRLVDAAGPPPVEASDVAHDMPSTVTIGTVAEWQTRWGSIAALRATMPIVFDGVTASEIRALTGLRELPPPFARGSRPVWMLTQEVFQRVTFSGDAPIPQPVPERSKTADSAEMGGSDR